MDKYLFSGRAIRACHCLSARISVGSLRPSGIVKSFAKLLYLTEMTDPSQRKDRSISNVSVGNKISKRKALLQRLH